ncbi:MAG: general secretion pathway protein GspB [Woeseiaceae bacterium]|nr:general secretion pathway protein GspB [Woeseiaceae bacterium]
MSFILDALKKSENDRQDSAPAEFTTVASSADAPAAPRWLWVLGGLLLVNAVVVTGLFLRPAPQTAVERGAIREPVAAQSAVAASQPAPAVSEFSQRVEAARRDQPQRSAPVAVQSQPAVQTTAVEPAPADRSAPADAAPAPSSVRSAPAATDPGQALLLPTLTDLRADGRVNLPELHIDIHVYSADPADRFVFINMNKYRENTRIAEGPDLRQITPDGVVLNYQGTTFLLPRE